MDKLLWIDLEMTGLDPDKERIIEIAMVLTDIDFNRLGDYHCVVRQDQAFIDAMDEWNQKTHSASGLIELIPNGKEQQVVDRECAQMVQTIFGEERAILAGNSIHQDRKFIDRYMPELAKTLHYRMLDVSSFKIIFKNKFGVHVEKGNNHRAIEDIEASIRELQSYLALVDPSHAKQS